MGVVFMLMINSCLLLIAAAFLVLQGALHSIWILFLSMIVVPVLCSLCCIKLFALLIDRHVDICRYAMCCGRESSAERRKAKRQRQSAQKLSIPLGQQRSQGPMWSPSSSSSVHEVL